MTPRPIQPRLGASQFHNARRESAEWMMNLAERQERWEHPATERHGWDRWLGERQLGSALHNLDHSATPFDTPVC